MKQTGKYVTLGIGHGINDCIAGYIIGSLFYQGHTPVQLGIYTLLYNIIAFGGQLAFAKVVETFFFPKKYLVASFILLTGSLVFLSSFVELAILFSGVASAIFHVTGGMEASRNDDKSFGIGLFASPGVAGLIAGGFLSYIHFDFIMPGMLLCIGYMLFVFRFYKTSGISLPSMQAEQKIEMHDVIMCILITVISLRSFIWDVVQMIQQDNYTWLTVIAIAAMCGKITGGFLADKIGHKKYTIWALVLSLPFLTLLKKNLIALSIGVFLLQSTIPSTTVMILQVIRRKPALAISISFGLSILIAISLFYTPAIRFLNNNLATIAVLTVSIILLLVYSRLIGKRKNPKETTH